METEAIALRKRRLSMVLAPQLFYGLLFVVSGTGKLPGQAEFADVLLQSFWGPVPAFLIAHLLPWAELVLGMALILNLWPRLAAFAGIPLILGFIANNGWALFQGMDKYPACGYCFGVFEKWIGALSPLQSLVIDLFLLVSALAVLFFHPDRFFRFRPWPVGRKAVRRDA
ncbi:MAG: DoxX family protein [Deltaproteobacteria bacterium]|nr:DoxX family protein [Deltaproteobacteria bacterium]